MSHAQHAARRRGFTLIELLIVIVVIAILALIVIPRLMGASRKAKDSTLKRNLHHLRNAVALYESDMGVYPTTLTDLYDSSGVTPLELWNGPYLKVEGAIIGTSAIPKNPYVDTTTVTDHWTYTAGTGIVIPATPAGLDMAGVAYNTY